MIKRLISALLCVSMMISLLPLNAAAFYVNEESEPSVPRTQEQIVLRTAEKEVSYQDEWEELYPFGAFAFADSDDGMTEGDGTYLLPVYRVGGLGGRASAIITYTPALLPLDEDGELTRAFALSGKTDLRIEVEDPQPIAQYQALAAKPRLPAPEGVALSYRENPENAELFEIYAENADGSALAADAYDWQYRDFDMNQWISFEDANEAALQIKIEDFLNDEGGLNFDYRLVYESGDAVYCTPSLLAPDYPYDPAADAQTDVPEDVAAITDPTYSVMEFENEFGSYQFLLTFAENEYIKYLRLTALDDEEPELEEIGLFTITGAVGGQTSTLSNTFTLTVTDNDEANRTASQLGFTEAEVTADQDAGEAVVTVKRTGDLSYLTAVKYATVDGTARAGQQYTPVSGELKFAVDVDTAEIRIPLLAEAAREDALSFGVELSDLRGEPCTLSELSRTTVTLSSSGMLLMAAKNDKPAAGLNLGSLLSTAGGSDVSAQTQDAEQPLLDSGSEASFSQQDAPAPLTASFVTPNTYLYPEAIRFSRKNYANYASGDFWLNWENVVGTHADGADVVHYRDRFIAPVFEKNSVSTDTPKNVFEPDNPDGVLVKHNDNTTEPAGLVIANAGDLFSSFRLKTRIAKWGVARYKLKENQFLYVMPYTRSIVGDTVTEFDYNPRHFTKEGCALGSFSWSQSTDLPFGSSYAVELGLTLNVNNPENPKEPAAPKKAANGSTQQFLTDLAFRRRVFTGTKELGLRIYTANDADLDNGFTVIDEYSPVYANLRPDVSIVEREGGINENGCLYVGSKLKISLKNTAAYQPYMGKTPDEAVYLTDTSGKKLPAKVEAGEDGVYYLTLLWDRITEEDLKASYIVNVVMARRQTVSISIRPSLERDQDGNVQTDEATLQKAWDRFLLVNGDQDRTITVKHGQYTQKEPHFSLKTETFRASALITRRNEAVFDAAPQELPELQNLYSINFGQDAGDFILINGRMYAGNEDIPLLQQDLSSATLSFQFYDEAFLNEQSIMEVTIDHTQLYYDANANGEIDGYFDESSGYFVLDEDSGDENIGILSGQYDQKMFAPQMDADGTIHQYFAKVYYTLSPRALKGGDETAQVLPAFITSLTDETAQGELTEEQLSYRCIRASATSILPFDAQTQTYGTRYRLEDSSEGHPMFGAEATRLSTVDIPLGGDLLDFVGSTFEEDGQTVSRELPDYRGNLRVPFADPAPVSVPNADGDLVPVEHLNEFLGAFVNNTTYLLCVQQSRTIRTQKDIEPESAAVGDLTAIAPGLVSDKIKGDGDLEAEGNPSQNGGKFGYGADFASDLKLPNLSFSAMNVDVTNLNGRQIMISAGIPVAKAQYQKYSKTEEYQKGSSATESAYTDTDGNTVKRTEYVTTVDGKKVTSSETVTTEPKKDTVLGDMGEGMTTGSTTTVTHRKVVGEDGETAYENTTVTEFWVEDQNGQRTNVGTKTRKDANPYEHASRFSNKSLDALKGGVKNFAFNDLAGIISKSKNGGFLAGNDPGYKNALAGSNKSFSVSASVALKGIILLEYDTIRGSWYLVKGTAAVTLMGNISIQTRFVPFPIAYIFFRVTVIGTGTLDWKITNDKSPICPVSLITDGEKPSSVKTLPATLSKGQAVVFALDLGPDSNQPNGFDLKLDGEIGVTVSDSPTDFDRKSGHYLTSAKFSDSKGGVHNVVLNNYGCTVYVSIVALKDGTTLSAVNECRYKTNRTHFDDVGIDVRIMAEIGGGIGIEIMKFEVYLRASVRLMFKFGGLNPKTGEHDINGMTGFYVDAALSARIKLILFEFSMDLVGIYCVGNRPGKDFKFDVQSYWNAFGKKQKDLLTLSAAPEDGQDTVSIRIEPPANTVETEKLERAVENTDGMLQAYDPTDSSVPFQLSGYGTDADAFRLASGLNGGYNYRAFTAKVPTEDGKEEDRTYLLYQRSVETDNSLNASQLVLSRVVLTGDQPGLQHPTDPKAANVFLPVDDQVSDAKNTGDLDFGVDVNGTTATVTWVSYSEHFGKDQTLTPDQAAQYTVVKQARIDLETDTAFTAPQEFSKTNFANTVYMPESAGSATFYAESQKETDPDWDTLFRTYIKAVYDVKDEELNSGETTPEKSGAVYRYKTEKARHSLYGAGSYLHAVLPDEAPVTLKIGAGSGEVLTNLEAAELNGGYILAYSTEQDAYLNPDGTTITENIDATTEYASIRRLYLCEFKDGSFGQPKLVRTAVDFDNENAENLASGRFVDGIYSNTQLQVQREDPNLANLTFQQADLNGEGKQTILTFELGGNAYLADEAALGAILAGEQAVVDPIFSAEKGTNVTVSSDEAGNLAVVWTAAMEATSNNAILCAWWDKELKAWGEEQILAMRYLQVYEDIQKTNLPEEDWEAAYLGQKTGNEAWNTAHEGKSERDKGGMNQSVFSGLQLLPAIVELEPERTEEQPEEAETRKQERLVLFCQATDETLKAVEGTDGNEATYIVPDEEKSGGSGFYAIAFGAGQQKLGATSLQFDVNRFSAGSTPTGTVSFRNSGTSAIRGSESNPITVGLHAYCEASGYLQTVASWKVGSSIPSGRVQELEFTAQPLSADLPAGTVFVLSVSEDAEYIQQQGGTAFSAVSEPLMTVRDCPELAVENPEFTMQSIDDEYVYFSAQFNVTNRGSRDAEDLFVQFTREDADGVLYPLDLTGSRLNVSRQTPILTASPSTDLQRGIFKLTDDLGKSSLASGNQRFVTGTLRVPRSVFAAAGSGSGLHLRMELFSDADTCDLIDQVYTVTKRNESAADDNVFEAVYEQTTLFELPGHLVFSLDNTLRTPVSYASTVEKSDIVVREISDGREDWKPILDLVYFDISHRTVVAVAGETGTTMIQVEDRSTNCFREIMVTVREIAQGINIYKDDDSFRFFNADGTRYDTADSGQDWIFTDISSGWKGSGLPMYGNYCIGESGAYVTFKTVATTLRIFYYGSITVTSDGFPLEVSANNTRTYEPLVVRFDNLEGRQHTVTIRLTTTGTQLDKYQATCPEETGVIDMNVADAPRIYWDRSFPNTASMKTGSSVTMGFYIVDRSGVEEVLVNGQKVQPQSIDANLSYVPVTFRENGTHVFEITSKQPGRKTTHTLPVYWFHTTVNSDAIATAPALDESLVDIVNRNGTPIHQNTDNAFLIYKAPVRPGEELHAYSSGYGLMYLDERDELNRTYASELRQYTGAFTLTRNGAQLLRIVAEDGTWRQTIRMLYNLIKGEPSISIYPENGILYLSGYADGPIQSVSVNGYRIPEEWGTSFSYPFPVTCSGDYTAEISDGRYTTRTTKYAWVPVTANDPVHVEMISDSACNVHFDPNRISGGQYNSGLSVPSENKYRAVYEYALVAVTNKTDTANPADATFGPDPDFTNIAFGWYVPMIRCADNWTDRVVLPAIRVGNVLDGELKIEGEPFHGRTLTAVYDGEVAGTLQYQWYRTYITTDVNGSKARTAIRGANGKEYVLVEDDILAKIDVEITSTGDSGKITSAQTEAVNLDADGWEGAYDGQMHTITVHDTEKYHAVFSDPWWTPIKDEPQGYSDSGRHWVTYYLAYSSSTKGRYNSISATRYIDIAPRDIRDGIVTLKKNSYLYTGEPITCEVESIYVGDISVPIDWRLGYRNRTATDPGQYTMTIIGFGDFTGEVSVDWEIVVGPGSPKPPEKPTEPTEPAEPTARPRPSKPDTPAKPAASAQPQTSKARSFTDVKADDWFAEGVRYVTERKLMNGVREGVFAPAQPVTRAMLVTILWRLDGSRYANYAMPFTDVPAQQWYTEAVRWAASEKLVEGVDKTRFDPDAPLSREQLAAILWRFAGYQNKKTASEQNLTQYQDAGSISLYAVPAFRWANETGLLGGTDAAHLSPKSGATRAQIAAILMRYLENL